MREIVIEIELSQNFVTYKERDRFKYRHFLTSEKWCSGNSKSTNRSKMEL